MNHRQVAVLKLRQNGYDAGSHVMLISDEGISIARTVADEIAAHERAVMDARSNDNP